VLSAGERADIDVLAACSAVRAARSCSDAEDVHAWVSGMVGRQRRRQAAAHRPLAQRQVSVDLRLYLRRRLVAIDRLIVRVVAALVAQAEQAGDTLMPAYTHLRRAQPILAAHWFLSHAAAFRRDADRIAVVSREADALPLGSGAIAGNSYRIDVPALASRLGFTRVVANSMDASPIATSSRRSSTPCRCAWST
jgi:argininosuccinate lyase